MLESLLFKVVELQDFHIDESFFLSSAKLSLPVKIVSTSQARESRVFYLPQRIFCVWSFQKCDQLLKARFPLTMGLFHCLYFSHVCVFNAGMIF